MIRLLGTAACAALVACGGHSGFRLTSDDNNRAQLVAALGQRHLPEQPTPENAARKPRLFALEAGAPKTIVAFDLMSGQAMWKVDADVKSRIQVGGDFVVELEGHDLVARDQQRGAVRWKVALAGDFVGSTADRDRAYMVWREGTKEQPKWWIAAYDGGTGGQLWKVDASGQLGAPTAQGGLVYSPFLSQWLSVLDAKTGRQLARVRGIDEQISMVTATSQDVYFGSKQGVFRLDARAASGRREGATYGKVIIPPQLDRASYGRDVYDPVQNQYTANDRARVLFRSEPGESTGAMKFVGNEYAIHYFRYVLGFGVDGELAWAYSHPRVELVASAHTGGAIVGVSATGDVVALDPKSGAVRWKGSLGTTAQVLGATIDADGWAPQGQPEPVGTVAALVAIARDRDARFDKVKELAVAALARLPGGEVTEQMLAVLGDRRQPQRLKDTVAELLAQRKDPASLPVLVQRLATKSDYLAQTEPEELGPIAKAIGGLASATIAPEAADAAVAALASHLDAPATQVPDLVLVIDAMAAIGQGRERPLLASHLLLYHADDDLGADPSWDRAIVHALVDHGGPGQRELLRHLAADPRTQPSLVSAINDALPE